MELSRYKNLTLLPVAVGLLAACGEVDKQETNTTTGKPLVIDSGEPTEQPDSAGESVTLQAELLTSSAGLAKEFPLLPVIEKFRWRVLLSAEKVAADAAKSNQQRNVAAAEANEIIRELRENHPFSSDESSVRLGKVSFDKKSRRITLPAEVRYPQDDKQGEEYPLELVLCSNRGRLHETIFLSDARPLHLELILHLNGFSKVGSGKKVAKFALSIEIPGAPPIPLEELVMDKDGKPLNGKIAWEFSGSSFADIYEPDHSGDFIICWHSHDSVLRIDHEEIASGRSILKAKRHLKLEEGMAVKLVLTPVE